MKSINPCKFEYRSNCRRSFWNEKRCDISSLYCNKAITCDELATINITTVNYGTNNIYVESKYCPSNCNSGFMYSSIYTRELIDVCNKKQVCDLSQWNTDTYWKLQVIYSCQGMYVL